MEDELVALEPLVGAQGLMDTEVEATLKPSRALMAAAVAAGGGRLGGRGPAVS